MRIAEVLVTIIRQMHAGAGTWQMPWHGRNALPIGVHHGRKYNGINRLILWSARIEHGYASRYWGTFNQWRARRQPVAAGQKGIAVIRPEHTNRRDNRTGPEDWRVFHVFNGDQVLRRNENHPDMFDGAPRPAYKADAAIAATGAQIRHEGHRAVYRLREDVICVPEPGAFFATATSTPTENYYSTLLHELVHWSGHPTRQDRQELGAGIRQQYAAEELVAELGAAFLCSELELETVPRPDHAQYLASWLAVLENDASHLVKAAGKGARAAEYILRFSDEATGAGQPAAR